NDADLDTAQRAYRALNPHSLKTLADKIALKVNPAELMVAKSYVNCTEDTSLSHQDGWHPRLSQKLGLFRLAQVPGSHELCFSNPAGLAQRLLPAGGHRSPGRPKTCLIDRTAEPPLRHREFPR